MGRWRCYGRGGTTMERDDLTIYSISHNGNLLLKHSLCSFVVWRLSVFFLVVEDEEIKHQKSSWLSLFGWRCRRRTS